MWVPGIELASMYVCLCICVSVYLCVCVSVYLWGEAYVHISEDPEDPLKLEL